MEDIIIRCEEEWDVLSNCKKQQLVWVDDAERIYGIISQYETQTATKFSSASRRASDFGKADYRTVKHDVYWDKVYGDTAIEFDGTPFMLVNEIKFACVHGPDQHKAKKRRAATDCNQPPVKKRRSLLPDTKKLDCPAGIIVKETIRFPDYSISKNTKWRKEIMSKKLRNDLQIAADIKTEVRYYVILPSICEHQNHIVGQLSVQHQTMDPNFVKKLEVLVSEGVQSVDEARLQLNRYLKELFPTGPLPSSKSKRFHPSKKSIKNRINIELNKVRSSLVHQDALELLINDYKERKPVDFVFFRKSVNEASKDASKLLLVCQTVDQKRLLQRYGSEICILDTTYKSLKYGLPLCMIYVKTNVDYQPVGLFVTQDSTAESISEGLRVLKEANSTKAAIQNIMVCLKDMISSSDEKVRLSKKEEMLVHLQKLYCIEEEMQCLVNSAFERIDGLRNLDVHEWDAEVESVLLSLSILEGASWDWNPPFFVASLCKEEIQAIETVFKSQVFVSNHYRHKAWVEWLNATSLGEAEQHELLHRLDMIANAESIADFEAAVLEMKGSNVWRQNLSFQRWFCNTWLDESRKWALAFRRDFFANDYTMWAVAFRQDLFDPHLDSTADSISTLNEVLRTRYLHSYFVNGHVHLALSELYFILMSQFFPDQYANYTTLNARSLSNNVSHVGDMPEFIQDRPHSFLSHCASRVLCSKNMSPVTISEMRPGLFELHCADEGITCVNFGDDNVLPSCTCLDWQQFKMPCKHFFLIFQECSVFWDALSSRYRNCPFFLLDDEVDINYEVVAIETVTNLDSASEDLQDDVVIAVHNLAFAEGDAVIDDSLHDFHVVPVALVNSSNITNIKETALSIVDIDVQEAGTVLQEQRDSTVAQAEDALAVHELELLANDLGIQHSDQDHHLSIIELHSSANDTNHKNSMLCNTDVMSGDVIIQDSGHDYHLTPIVTSPATIAADTNGDLVVRAVDLNMGDIVIHSSGHDYHVAQNDAGTMNNIGNIKSDSEPSTVVLKDSVFAEQNEYCDTVFQTGEVSQAKEEPASVCIAQAETDTYETLNNDSELDDEESESDLLKKIEQQLRQVSDPTILQEAYRRLKWVEELLNNSSPAET